MKSYTTGFMKMIKAGAIACITAAILTGCAKANDDNSNIDAQRYLEAWMHVNYPTIKATGNGIYVLDETPGSGAEYNGEFFVFLNITIRDLDGTITSTTSEKISKQTGDFTYSDYYGATVNYAYEDYMAEGLEEMLQGMKIGGKKTAVIPTWLLTTDRYKKASDYLKHTTSNETSIYEIELTECTDNVSQWEIDTLDSWVKHNIQVDSISSGYYYKQIDAPTDTTSFSSDTTIYVNYVGKLLNGHVFDTNIADTAKFYHLYSASSSYEPLGITWGEEEDELDMEDDDSSSSYYSTSSSSSSIITGWQKCLWSMRANEHGIVAFTSGYGYSYSGSGTAIPGYAPLVFEIWLVAEPEDDDD